MRVRNLKTTMLGVLCAGAVALGGGREGYDYWWNHPCPPLDCDLMEPPFCWCEADWDDEDNWHGITYPHEPDDSSIIKHSNTGLEDYLKVNLSTETIWSLKIRTKATPGSDKLSITFADTGTLTLSGLSLDATYGPIKVKVTDTATLKTN